MTGEPRRPRWRRKRWAAALLLWLAAAYPLSLWPVAYAVSRGWLPVARLKAVYAPVLSAAEALAPRPTVGYDHMDDGTARIVFVPDPDPPPWAVGVVAEGYLDVSEWFVALGRRHTGSE